jgi:hypothetical protein
VNGKSERESASKELVLLREEQSNAAMNGNEGRLCGIGNKDNEFVWGHVCDAIGLSDTFLQLNRDALKSAIGGVRTHHSAKEFVIGEMNGNEELGSGETWVARVSRILGESEAVREAGQGVKRNRGQGGRKIGAKSGLQDPPESAFVHNPGARNLSPPLEDNGWQYLYRQGRQK